LLETFKGINRILATGTLSRDVCPHGPKIDSEYFLCTMYAWGLCTFLEMEIYSEGTTHGDLTANKLSAAVVVAVPVGSQGLRHLDGAKACQPTVSR